MIKRYISMILVVMLLITALPLQVLADTSLGGNTQSGGSSGVGSDAAYAHKYFCYPENMGYRISIVDKEGYRVANSIDIIKYIPTDINNITYDNSNNGYGRKEFVDGYNQYKSWLGDYDYSSEGLNKLNSIYYSNGIKTEPYSNKTWNTNGVPSTFNKDGELIETNVYTMAFLETLITAAYNSKVSELKSEDPLEYANLQTIPDISIPLPSILNESKTAFEPGGVKLIELMQSSVGGDSTEDSINVLSLIAGMKVRLCDNKGNITKKNDYLFRFSDPAEQARVGQKEIDNITGEEKLIQVKDIVIEQGYKVVIESLYWYVPHVQCIHPEKVAEANGTWGGWIKGVCYGTTSYIQKYVYENFKNLLTDEHMKLTFSGPNWGPGDLGCTTLMLEHNDEELKIYEPSSAPVALQYVYMGDTPAGISLYSLASGDQARECGYAVHIYDNLLQTGLSYTHTYDSENYPAKNYSPGPAPDPTSLPNEDGEYIKQGKNKNVTIIKYYCIDNGDGTYKYIENHTRESNPHTIEIENEGDFVVVDYFSSPTVQKPTSNTTSYDTTKTQVPMGTVQGDSPDDVVLTTDNCLYVKLCRKRQVVKIYETDGVVDKIKTETPTIENNEYTVNTPDSGYNYQESLISPDVNVNPTTWEDVENLANGTPSEGLTLKIPDTTKVIYIRYTKDSSNNALVLHENEISHNFNLRDITGDLLKTSRHYKYISVPDCDYFYDCGCSDDDDSCDCWSCNDDMDQESPGTYYFEVVNKPSYDTQFVYKWKESNTVYNGKGGGYQGFEVEASPYMEFTLSRAYTDNFYENRSQGSVFFYFLQHYSSKLFRG